MPSLNGLVFLVALALLVVLLGLSLGALGLLAGAVFPQRVARAQNALRAASFRLGLLHGVGLLALLVASERRPLVGLVALVWLVFALLCLLLGLAALVRQVSLLLFPMLSRWRGHLAAAAILAWACAFPWVGWVLGVGLLVTAYAAGLAGWLHKPEPAAFPADVVPRNMERAHEVGATSTTGEDHGRV